MSFLTIALNSIILVGLMQFSESASALRGSEDAPAPFALLDELERVLGEEHRLATQKRIGQLEDALRPMYLAMPKGEMGTLQPDGVRYLLHRLFVNKHGWFVRGLDSAGDSYNSSSPSALFKEHVGDDLHDVFEEQLCRNGFSLHETAVMAATLETLVRTDTLERLHVAYGLVDMSEEGSSTEEQALAAVDAYMMMYVLGAKHATMTKAKFAKYQKVIYKVYPTWDVTKQWVREIRHEVLSANPGLSPTSFNATERTLEEMEDRYGKWQNRECQDLKSLLLKMEEKGTGRVRLGTFYHSSLNGNWQFSESEDYLRLLGALDESEPERLQVIIPNYINAPSNCVASSKFYSVCCIDECQALMQNLETQVVAPEATPSRLIQLVASMPSATVQAPRLLTSSLVQKLEDIAAHHNGMVPLHGRLFTQWLHHAYPRECSYPHLAGTTKPKNPMQWIKETGKQTKADQATMRRHAEEALASQSQSEETDAEYLPWLHEEELFVARTSNDKSFLRSSIRILAFLAVAASVIVAMKKQLTGALNSICLQGSQKDLPRFV